MTTNPSPRPRRAAYSVAQTAALCGISRSRFYDLVGTGVMPPPVYSLRTRRPHYPSELAALCVRIRETNVGFDGHFVMFYDRKPKSPTPVISPQPSRNGRKAASLDPLTQEMAEAVRKTGVRASEAEVLDAIQRQCPSGVTDATFETDWRAIYEALRCREAV